MSSNDLLPYQQRPVGRRLRSAEPGEDVDERGGGELLGGGAVDAGQHQVEPLREAVLIVGLLIAHVWKNRKVFDYVDCVCSI